MAGRTILLVDDEPVLVKGLKRILEREGYRVLTAADGRQALAEARSHQPDLVVLDLMLPEVDGLNVCRELRTFSSAPVIILSARGEEVDRVVGLEVGADDYMVKPFSSRELVARIRAQLRRAQEYAGVHRQAAVLKVGELAVNLESRMVTLGCCPVDFTAREFDLLVALARRPGKVYTREELLDLVWGFEAGDTRVVDTYIRRLREKLEADAGKPRLLLTRWGVGYYLAIPGAEEG